MKKSELYHTLQQIVVTDSELYEEDKLEILRELFAQEDLAKFSEEQEAKEK